MPTRVDRVKLLVMTNPQGVLISPHPHFYPWDMPVVLMPMARIPIPRLLSQGEVCSASVVSCDGRISQSFCSQKISSENSVTH